MLSRKEGSVGYVIFNNPERHNAVSLDMWQMAGEMLDDFRNDNNIKVVVVTGAGGKAFVSGADISRFEKERSNEDAVKHYNEVVDKSYRAFHEFPKPVIAMIRGYCIGGGMGLATCCDIRIATEKSTFAVPAAKLGLGYGYSGLKRLVDVVGPSFAMEIFYTARQFTAAEARDDGPRESCRSRRRTGKLRAELRRYDRRQRAADHQGGQDRGQRDDEGRESSAISIGRRRRWTPASRAAIMRKAARPSWKSASRCSRRS